MEAIDGGYGRFGVNARPGDADTNTEFVYELPAPTTFERFAVPNVLETPSPHQTFVRELHIEGSATREPIARNDTESGRSLNRRVEVECAG